MNVRKLRYGYGLKPVCAFQGSTRVYRVVDDVLSIQRSQAARRVFLCLVVRTKICGGIGGSTNTAISGSLLCPPRVLIAMHAEDFGLPPVLTRRMLKATSAYLVHLFCPDIRRGIESQKHDRHNSETVVWTKRLLHSAPSALPTCRVQVAFKTSLFGKTLKENTKGRLILARHAGNSHLLRVSRANEGQQRGHPLTLGHAKRGRLSPLRHRAA